MSSPATLTLVTAARPQDPDASLLRPRRHRTSLRLGLIDIENEKTRPGGQPDGSSHMALGVDGRSRQI
jgi:hypothetical protein